jgi:hypothetical protein
MNENEDGKLGPGGKPAVLKIIFDRGTHRFNVAGPFGDGILFHGMLERAKRAFNRRGGTSSDEGIMREAPSDQSVVELIIQIDLQTKRHDVSGPLGDDILFCGMLEMAKVVFSEMRFGNKLRTGDGLFLPRPRSLIM